MDEQAPEAMEPTALSVEVRERSGGRWGAAAVVASWAMFGSLMVLAGVGRTWLAAPVWVSIAVSVLPYLFLGLGAGVFSLWCVVPDRRSLPILLVLWTLSGGALWAPSVQGAAPPSDAEAIRVLSWNVRRFWGSSAGLVTEPQIDAATVCIQKAIQAQNPNVLVLLETSADDLKRLADLNLTCVQGDYYGTGDAKSAGVAVCTRGAAKLKGGGPRRFVDSDDWSYVFAEVEYRGSVMNVMGVHLEPYHSEAGALKAGIHGLRHGDPDAILQLQRAGESVVRAQVDQSGALLDTLSRLQDPTIVAGDFNSTPDMALHFNLRRILRDTWVDSGNGFGTTARVLGRLPVRIDYIYATSQLQSVYSSIESADCSDHRGVVSDLKLVGMDDRPIGAQGR